MYHFKECGLDNIHLKNGYSVIETAEGKAVSIKDIDSLHRAIAQCIIKKDESISGKEFRFLRIELDLSQKAIGKLMEYTDQTIAKWEKGAEPVPVLADKAIRDLYVEKEGGGIIAGLLKRLSEVDRQLHEIKLEIELKEQDRSWHVLSMAC